MATEGEHRVVLLFNCKQRVCVPLVSVVKN